jgi:DNA polymerase-3 subunit epsilon
MQPLYNRQLRKHQKLTLAKKTIDDRGYINIDLEDVAEIDPESIGQVLAVYSTKGKARRFITDILRDFGLCPRLMGIENGRGGCFAYQLKRCSGACLGREVPAAYNSRLLAAFERQRLQNWPFESPVLIAERTDLDGLSSIVVDKWCVIASIKQQPDCEPVVQLQDKMFDLDTYKILRSFLTSKSHKLHIKPVASEWVRQVTLAGIV